MSSSFSRLLSAAFLSLGLFLFSTLSVQAASAAALIGQTVTLSVAASGTAPFSYQWSKDGVPLSGVTGAQYQISSAHLANAGVYNVVVSNPAGSTSGNATLTVSAASGVAPTFTYQPYSNTVAAGTPISMAASASGVPAPTYQWRKNGVAVSGATNPIISLVNPTPADSGTYTVVATNSAGSATSTGALLTVTAVSGAPVITTQPVAQVVTAGTSVNFAAAASGTPAPTYQWRKDGVNIAGATGTSYTIGSANAGSTGTYTFVAMNSAGSATSTGAMLTVNAVVSLPSIITQPNSHTVSDGATVTLSVVATGSGTLGYQWRKNGTDVAGANQASFVLNGVTTVNAGTYTVVITNPAGSVTSNGAVLTVNSTSASLTRGADFNRDGNSDILWQNSTTGEWSVWYMNGTQLANGVLAGTQPTVWQLRGTGDFNRDGQTDLLWQNSSSGEWRIFLMNGLSIGSSISLGFVSPDWELNGTGDFNGDGQPDILMQNTLTGEAGLWLMTGSTGTTVLRKISLGAMVGWQMVGSGDFNRDGQSDILWQNPITGEARVSLMAGTTVARNVSLGFVDTAWEMSGTGDFNKDGQSDILWQNRTSGDCSVWLMNGTSVSSAVSLGTVAQWIIRN